MKNWLINLVAKFVAPRLQGYRTYLLGGACLMVGIALSVGKLMLPEQFGWLNWVEQIGPWYAFGIYCFTQGAKGNRAIDETQKVSGMIEDLFSQMEDHRKELKTIKANVQAPAEKSPSQEIPTSASSGKKWDGKNSAGFYQGP